MAIAIGRSDADRLIGVGEVCRNGLRDIADGANLHHCRLGLLQDQFFVNRANLGLLFERLLAARAVFLGGGHRDVVFDVAHAGGVFGVNHQRMLVGVEVNVLALGVDVVLPVVLVPLGHGRVLVHVFDDLAPADAGV